MAPCFADTYEQGHEMSKPENIFNKQKPLIGGEERRTRQLVNEKNKNPHDGTYAHTSTPT